MEILVNANNGIFVFMLYIYPNMLIDNKFFAADIVQRGFVVKWCLNSQFIDQTMCDAKCASFFSPLISFYRIGYHLTVFFFSYFFTLLFWVH